MTAIRARYRDNIPGTLSEALADRRRELAHVRGQLDAALAALERVRRYATSLTNAGPLTGDQVSSELHALCRGEQLTDRGAAR